MPGIIASKRCNHVNIYNNEVHDGGALAAGIFLHRSSNRAKVYGEEREEKRREGGGRAHRNSPSLLHLHAKKAPILKSDLRCIIHT